MEMVRSTAPRYKLNQEGIVNGDRVTITNISQDGLFIKLSRHLKQGDKVNIYWNMGDQEIQISGVIVHTNEEQGHGVRLIHTVDTNRQIGAVIQKLHSQGMMLRARGPIESDESDLVFAWIKILFGEKSIAFAKRK